MRIKIMTYNIQHGMDFKAYLKDKSHIMDLNLAAGVIKHLGAEIIGLNEVRGDCTDPDYCDQTKVIADILGYRYYYFAEAIKFEGYKPYGNALISKYPIKNAQTVMIPDPIIKDEDSYYETRCIIKSEIDVPGGLTVFVTHIGLANSEKKNAVNTIAEEIKKVNGPLVLMGDFNLCPDNPVLLPVQKLLKDSADFFSNSKLSSPSHIPTEKIDYIFYNDCVKLFGADIPEIIASDHRPHTAVIEI